MESEANFVGRAGSLLLFTFEERGAIIDSTYGLVVASGKADILLDSADWGDGEFSSTDAALAQKSLDTLDTAAAEPTGRLYTIPTGVQRAARRGLQDLDSVRRGGSEVALYTANLLASGGQVDFARLQHLSKFFTRHESERFTGAWDPATDGKPSAARITRNLWGGDTAQKWASSIVHREAEKTLQAAGVLLEPETPPDDPFIRANDLDPESGPEFLVRIRLDGSGIDRLYRIDINGEVFLWDDNVWDDLGQVSTDIYALDAALDDPLDTVEKTHVVVDPASAVIIGSRLSDDPFEPVRLEDINEDEAALVASAIEALDWDLLNKSLTAALPASSHDITPGQYTPQERSDNASAQVRDSQGRFATMGSRVMVGDNPQQTGNIVKIDPATQTVGVQLESGGTINVPAKSVASVGQYAATIPGKPVVVPRVDTSGILAEPRTPINNAKAHIPGTLPAMTSKDLKDLLSNWPAWVQSQRQQFKAQPTPSNVNVQAKGSLTTGKTGQRIAEQTGQTLWTDPYSQPLIADWLKKKKNSIWYQPVRGSGAPEATPTGESAELTPDTSDVQPVYMAIVAPDDPHAVTALVALVPASSTSTGPMIYSREDGEWNRDPKTLAALNSATPPPVVPLDEASLDDVLRQVDSTQEAQPDANEPLPTAQDVAASPADAQAPAPEQTPVTASGYTADQMFAILVGNGSLTAAGGLDRNRGQAEKLRRYWTVGLGGAKIRWGTPGDWTRCHRHLAKYLGKRSAGYCSLRHKEMTGMWPGDATNRAMHASADLSLVTSEDAFLRNVLVEARAHSARLRMQSILSSGAPLNAADYLLGRIYAEDELTASAFDAMPMQEIKPGAAFIIPLVLPIGVVSGDKREIDENADIDIRDLPLPLLWQIQTAEGHSGSVVVGRIDSIENTPTGVRNARGVFDTGVYGREAERLVRERFLSHVSADMDNFEAQEGPTLAEDEKAADGPELIRQRSVVVTRTRIMAVTIVAKPAFQECEIFLEEDLLPEEETPMIPDGLYVDDGDVDPILAASIVAAGYVADNIPLAPPASWFQAPDLDRVTPITVSDSGRVFGHIASWQTDHIGKSFSLKAPRSKSNYAYFQTGVLRTEEGTDVKVGQLTLTGGHAGLEFSAREAARHYDDTGSAVADVSVGEDEFGIWVSGALRPTITPEQIRVLRASAPSGDWRRIHGNLELVAVCEVNVPGFPVARTLVASGQPMSLVAAGAMVLAKMKSDPVSEMQERLDKLEQFALTELSEKAAPAKERFAALKAEQAAELAAKAEALSTRFSEASNFAFVPFKKRQDLAKQGHAMPDGSFPIVNPDDLNRAIQAYKVVKPADRKKVRDHITKRARALNKMDLIPEKWKTASVDEVSEAVFALRERIDLFANQDRKNKEKKAEQIAGENPLGLTPGKPGDLRVKYTPKTQPRDEEGKFRLILARLRDNLGTSGNQAIMDKIKAVENLDNAGNYKEASKSAADLVNTLDRVGTGTLDPGAIATIRDASTQLSKVIANLPLPFSDQTQKIRFSDLPPVLRELTQTLLKKVEDKLSKEDAAEATAKLKSFMSGGDLFSQSDVSSQLNKMLHLLV